MRHATAVGTARHRTGLPWGDVLLSAIAAVSWSLLGMAGVAALGLHLLEADSAGSLGPMTAAVVALGAGGAVTPSGDVSAFGLEGADVGTAIEITPLGVSLTGALLLSWFFLRSLRTAGVVIAPAELLARAGAVVALFVASLGGLAWAGHDVITIDGGRLGLDRVPGADVDIPGLGDLGDVGGLLPGRIGDLVHAKAAVGFTVDTAPTLLGGLGWSAGVLLIALLASRRTPLPRGWDALHRVVRPAVSAMVTVALVAVAAGLAAAGYAAIGDDHPKRIAGAALLGAPDGVWLGIPLGLFVPWDGRAGGALATLLPDPLDRLLSTRTDEPVTLGRLAELDGRVWLLAVAAALMMLLAGVLTAVRTPTGPRTPGGLAAPTGPGGSGGPHTPAGARGSAGPRGSGEPPAPAGAGPGVGVIGAGPGVRGAQGAAGFAGRCALRLGVVTTLTLPLLAWLTDVSVNASLSVLGIDAFGAGIELHGHLGTALLLGAVWGAGAGAAGALLAWACGTAGWRAAPLALGGGGEGRAVAGDGGGYGDGDGEGHGYRYGTGGGLTGAGPGGRPEYRDDGGESDRLDGWSEDRAADGRGGHGPAGHEDHGGGGRAGAGGGGHAGAGSGGHAGAGSGGRAAAAGAGDDGRAGTGGRGHAGAGGGGSSGGVPGPYSRSVPYRPPNPGTNPYLRIPDELRTPGGSRSPGDTRPPSGPRGPGGGAEGPSAPAGDDAGGPSAPTGGATAPGAAGAGAASDGSSGPVAGPAPTPPSVPPQPVEEPSSSDDVYGAPTMAGPLEPPPPPPRGGRGSRPRGRSSDESDGPVPPPPPPPTPPPPPRRPKGPRR